MGGPTVYVWIVYQKDWVIAKWVSNPEFDCNSDNVCVSRLMLSDLFGARILIESTDRIENKILTKPNKVYNRAYNTTSHRPIIIEKYFKNKYSLNDIPQIKSNFNTTFIARLPEFRLLFSMISKQWCSVAHSRIAFSEYLFFFFSGNNT